MSDGFVAYYDPDGNPVYAGRGNNVDCSNQNPSPAKISIDPVTPGALMSCTSFENNDQVSAYYIQDNPMVGLYQPIKNQLLIF
jgi:hypothetical protein